jgi:2-oxoglutarate dehydrogenase E2 component (dihydrolipoamide succinyltransferase)
VEEEGRRDAVAADEILIEIETDKVVLEVPAPGGGVLAELVVAMDGDSVASDEVIARIDTEAVVGAAAPVAAPAAVASAAPAAAVAASPAGGSKADVAMPAAAKLLADNGHEHCASAWLRQGRSRHQG